LPNDGIESVSERLNQGVCEWASIERRLRDLNTIVSLKRPSHAVESLGNILAERGPGGKLLEKPKYSILTLVVGFQSILIE